MPTLPEFEGDVNEECGDDAELFIVGPFLFGRDGFSLKLGKALLKQFAVLPVFHRLVGRVGLDFVKVDGANFHSDDVGFFGGSLARYGFNGGARTTGYRLPRRSG
jgi:hypothetical protein